MNNRAMWQFIGQRLVFGGFRPLAARILWQLWPGMLTCAVFWAQGCVMPFVRRGRSSAEDSTPDTRIPTWRIATALIGIPLLCVGTIMNAVVTLANGGVMPVTNIDAAADIGHSLWVRGTGAHRLLWLADNYWGFSLGDFCLCAAAVLLAIAFIGAEKPPKKKVSDTTTSTTVWRVFAGTIAFFQSTDAWAYPVTFFLITGVSFAFYVFTLVMEFRSREWRLEYERLEREWREYSERSSYHVNEFGEAISGQPVHTI